MPNWTFVEAHNYTFNAVSSYAVPIPQDLELGDIIFIVFHGFVGAAANPLVLPTANFTNISYDDEGGTEEKLIGIGSNGYNPHLLYRIVDGSEPTTATFETNILTFSNSCVTVFVYRPSAGFTFTGFGESELYTTDSLVKVGSTALEFTEDPINVAEESNVWALWLLGTNADTITEGTDSGTLRFANAANYATVALYDGEVTPSTNLADRKIYLSPTNTASPDAVILLKAEFDVLEINRIRSSMTVNAGSLTELSDVRGIDGTFSETFLPDVDLNNYELQDYINLLKPSEIAMKYYPLPLRSGNFESAYEGVTKLSRLEFDAPRIVAQVKDIEELQAHLVGDAVPLKRAMDYFFSECASLYPWFTYVSNPALHYPVGINESEELFVTAFLIPQTSDNKVSIREVIDELLPITPSILHQNADGDIQIIALHGPDAFSNGTTLLEPKDILAPLLDSKPDPRGIYNAAEYKERAFEFVPAQEVMQAAFQAISPYEDAVFDLPGGRVAMDEDDGFTLFLERLSPTAQRYFWPVAADTLIGDNRVIIDYSINVYAKQTSQVQVNGTLTTEYQEIVLTADAAATATSFSVEALDFDLPDGRVIYFEGDRVFVDGAHSAGATTLNVTAVSVARTSGDVGMTSTKSIPLDGTTNEIFDITFQVGILPEGRLRMLSRFDSVQDGFIVWFDIAELHHPVPNFVGEAATLDYGVAISLNGFGQKFQQAAASLTARFGFDDEDTLPAIEGSETGNALEDSRAIFGRRSKDIVNNYFSIGIVEGVKIARAFVLANINPKYFWDVKQSYYSQVDFDDVGQQFLMPNGIQGLVEARALQDERSYTGATWSDTFRLFQTDQQYLDENTCYLLDEEGEFLLDEEGNFLFDEICEIPPVVADQDNSGNPIAPSVPPEPPPQPSRPSGPYTATFSTWRELAAYSASPGDTLFLQAGFDTSIEAGSIFVDMQGTSGNRITIVVDESHVMSGNNVADNTDYKLWFRDCEYLDVFGGRLKDMPYQGFYFRDCENCTFNGLSSLESYLSGFYAESGNVNNVWNQIQSLGSHQGGDADGFGFGDETNTDNTINDSDAGHNSDDGFDAFKSIRTKFNRCRAWENGLSYKGTTGDGQGFKLGFSTTSSTGLAEANDCLSWKNKSNGFDRNLSPFAILVRRCVAWDNDGAGYILGAADTTTGNYSSENGSADTSPNGGITNIADANTGFESTNPADTNFLRVV